MTSTQPRIKRNPKNSSHRYKGVSKIVPLALLASAIITISIIMANPAYGHRLISHDGTHTNFDSALQIPDHRISWAVYDNLTMDGAKFYAFEGERGDSFYMSILIPKMDGLEEYSPTLFLVKPAGFEGQPVPFEDWPNTERFPYEEKFPGDEFYEPFGQVTYWERQEVRSYLPADGKYFIVVVDEEGQGGKYALSIGTIEDFSGENFLVVIATGWFETKLFVNDHLSVGTLFFALAAIPTIVALAAMRKKSRQSVSKN